MKKKITLLFTLFFSFFASLSAQAPYFYYYKGEKIYVTVNRNFLNIIVDEELQEPELSQYFILQSYRNDSAQRLIKLEFITTPSVLEYTNIINDLKQNGQIKYALPFFENGNAPPIGTSDIFYVKLKQIEDTTLLRNLAIQQNVQIIKQVLYMPLWYVLSIQNSSFTNSLEVTNYFYETGYFEDIDPAFMFNFEPSCSNDPEFYQLWGLQNTSNPGIDINVCDAWAITRGAGINVAVVDNIIDKTHRDLANNMHSLHFDLYGGIGGSRHGTLVTGVIAAVKDNHLDVVGVAPESKIMGVSHTFGGNVYMHMELASGISWAWQNGADVINNSWYDPQGGIHHGAILEDAIIDAMTRGRGGKGCVVVFAAGNNGTHHLYYPGNFHDDILTVGAISNDGTRGVFYHGSSNYGKKLDVVAPGVGILSTDYNNGLHSNSGTSLAAPHVSGIAALILSVNPELTGQQVRDIIESTATKIRPDLYNYHSIQERPNGAWNDELGYGLVNAFLAVFKALNEECSDDLPIANGVITKNTIWNTPIYALGTTIVPDGVTLTIESQVKCDVAASFIVQPGGKLIVDGGTLTNACEDKMWQGITVLGDRRAPVTSEYQGFVQIMNGGAIENAICAIHSIHGGLIDANGAHFVNNTTAVKIDPIAQPEIRARFTNTQFIINNDYLENPLDFETHLKLSECGIVTVYGCTFLNEADKKSYATGKNTGIWAFNSSLTVDECYWSLPSTFSGFNVAVSASNSGKTPAVNIQNSIFTDNLYGIRLNTVDYAKLINNNFKLTQFGAYGMHISNSTGYAIEENHFQDISKSGTQTVGLTISNSGADENVVYKNIFEGLYVGQQFLGKNSSNGVPRVAGLQTLCNVFKKNQHRDILVGPLPFLRPPAMEHSIRQVQGTPQRPAGNEFSGNLVHHFESDSPYNIEYFYYKDEPNVLGNINKHATLTPNNCSSNNTGSSQNGSEDLNYALIQYNEWNAEYESWLTELFAFEGDNEEEYNELLDMVSYYSALKDNHFNAIIVAMMNEEEEEEEEAPNGIMFVMSGDNENEVENEIPGIVGLTHNNGATSPSNLEGVPEGRGSLHRLLLAHRGSYTDYLSIVETYIKESNYEEAMTTLIGMHEWFEIIEEQSVELSALSMYIHWLQQLEEEEKSIYTLSSGEVNRLINYVKTHTGRGTVFVKNILCELYEICIEEEEEAASSGASFAIGGEEPVGAENLLPKKETSPSNFEGVPEERGSLYENITLHPNPTTGELTITITGQVYNDGELRVENIEIFDVFGKKLSSHHSSPLTPHSPLLINISHLNPGIYFVKITTDTGEVVKKVVKQ